MDVLAGVGYLHSEHVCESPPSQVQKYTNWWVCSGGQWFWRKAKITEPRQERMGLESNVCAGGIFWTRSNPCWQGECRYCQQYIKLAYHEETLIWLFECSLHFYLFFLPPHGQHEGFWLSRRSRYTGTKERKVRIVGEEGMGKGHKMLLEIIRTPSNKSGFILGLFWICLKHRAVTQIAVLHFLTFTVFKHPPPQKKKNQMHKEDVLPLFLHFNSLFFFPTTWTFSPCKQACKICMAALKRWLF